MRRIDKTKILAVEYKKWVDKLNRDNRKHPRTRTYYYDVVMNLLHCQKGVCAYTEMIVCDPELLDEDNWENGRYNFKSADNLGSLEHFDPQLKKDKFWEWDNLFVIHLKINVTKGANEVDDILKPDSPEYDPFRLLAYSTRTHRFYPRPELEDATVKRRIRRMIKILQLNHGTVRYERETFLKKVFKYLKLDHIIKIDRFFTAYEMAAAARKEVEE
jgi:hypothetical protein